MYGPQAGYTGFRPVKQQTTKLSVDTSYKLWRFRNGDLVFPCGKCKKGDRDIRICTRIYTYVYVYVCAYIYNIYIIYIRERETESEMQIHL